MRVGIVNDMMMAVEALRRVVQSGPEHAVAWIARDGAEAVAKCAQDTPDVVLMDLIMPVMDGVEATRRIMAETPCPILVVTASVRTNAAKVFEAMGHGALDAVRTPSLGADGGLTGGAELLAKIATIGRLTGKTGAFARVTAPPPPPAHAGAVPPLVAIGSSSGGPKALAALLGGLPASFPAAIVVIQHVNARFAPGMAEWLNGQTGLEVRPVAEGECVTPGVVLLPATDDHLVLHADLSLHFTPEPRSCPFRPSVDAFFHSAGRHWPEKATAVLLTGMGRDGAEGLLALRRAGWHTIAQDEATSVVYGMPKAAAEIDAAADILPLEKIAPALLARLPAAADDRPHPGPHRGGRPPDGEQR